MIAFLDVDYRDGGARAGCVLVASWQDAGPIASFVADIDHVQPYQPGRFYLRELPCLMAVLALVPKKPELLVVDGYVWLDAHKRPGLGAHLYNEFGATPVAGIAKKAFQAADDSDLVARVFRGSSTKPLFVTAVGVDLKDIARSVTIMHGEHRIPSILQRTDQLARSHLKLPCDSRQ